MGDEHNMGKKLTYRTPYSKLIGALKNSATKKCNAGWSRKIGAGFIAEDIEYIQYRKDGLRFKFSWDSQTIRFSDLNLRETEEALKWAEKKEAQWEFNQRTKSIDDEERTNRYKKYVRETKKRWTEEETQRYLAPRMR